MLKRREDKATCLGIHRLHPTVHCFAPFRNAEYLSAKKYVELIMTEEASKLSSENKETCYAFIHGPAVQKTFTTYDITTDLVGAFPLKCPDIVKKWQQRNRHYDWPPKEILEKATEHQSYVVPVGQKGHALEEFQWRLCFTETEMALVHAMTDTQFKTYVLLRLLAKHLLTPLSDGISSYVVKNVMFWIMEGNPVEKFCSHGLIDCVTAAVELLLKSVEGMQLPMYMLPDRNLFEGKMQDSAVCDKILDQLKVILREGVSELKCFMDNLENFENLHTLNRVGLHVYSSLVITKRANVKSLRMIGDRDSKNIMRALIRGNSKSSFLLWLGGHYISYVNILPPPTPACVCEPFERANYP